MLVLHHRGKGAERYRGSEEILANVDMAFELKRDGQNGRTLHNFKNRDGKDDFDIDFSCDFERGIFTCMDTAVEAARTNPLQVLQTILERQPGISVNKIVGASGLRREDVIVILREKDGILWRSEAGLRRSRIYFPLGTVCSKSSLTP